jgi:hypothetical protein
VFDALSGTDQGRVSDVIFHVLHRDSNSARSDMGVCSSDDSITRFFLIKVTRARLFYFRPRTARKQRCRIDFGRR